MAATNREKRRAARFHLLGPAPFGCSLHTCDLDQVRAAIAGGYTVSRVVMLPTDPIRLAALVEASRS